MWNPATHKFTVIPHSPVESIESLVPDILEHFISFSVVSYLQGFGYDSVIDDYKLIRYVCFVYDVHNSPLEQNLVDKEGGPTTRIIIYKENILPIGRM